MENIIYDLSLGIGGISHICKNKHKREEEPIEKHTTYTLLDYYEPITSKNNWKIDFSDTV